MSHVVDASAAFALLNDEPGAATVRKVLSASIMASVNFGEIVSIYARAGVGRTDIETSLLILDMQIVPVGRELAFDAGLLLPLCRKAGLSLGDRICLALARQRELPALTADRAWLTIAADVGVTVELIR